MKIYNIATEVAKAVSERHAIQTSYDMDLGEQKLRLANYQSVITEKLAQFLDEATVEVNRSANLKQVEEIETLRSSLMDSITFEDIMRPELV